MKNPISVNNALHGRIKALWRDPSGATAVEFVMVFMIVVFITIAIFEFGLAWYAYSRAELATQWGVRLAVESDPVASGFTTWNAVTTGGFDSGTTLDTGTLAAFSLTCTNTACTCPGGGCVVGTGHDAAAFTAIYDKVRTFVWNAQPTNMVIDYKHVGMGFAGRPGIDIVPNVTVRLVNLPYNLLILTLFYPAEVPATFNMGEFKSTLPGEDLCSSGSSC